MLSYVHTEHKSHRLEIDSMFSCSLAYCEQSFKPRKTQKKMQLFNMKDVLLLIPLDVWM